MAIDVDVPILTDTTKVIDLRGPELRQQTGIWYDGSKIVIDIDVPFAKTNVATSTLIRPPRPFGRSHPPWGFKNHRKIINYKENQPIFSQISLDGEWAKNEP